MTAILDAPVTAIDGKELLGVCFVWLSAGDAVVDVVGIFSALFLSIPARSRMLVPRGEVEVGVELGRGPDLAGFDPAMIRGL